MQNQHQSDHTASSPMIEALNDLAKSTRRLPFALAGLKFARQWPNKPVAGSREASDHRRDETSNPLRDYFEGHVSGRGIWKWEHYFEVYHRHFSKFVGKQVHILEIGIYSGGSLEMWKEYFGDQCHIYGVDIEAACKTYEEEGVRVFIGDQADRGFWRKFKEEVPRVDILIDDGGHTPEQQIVTLEEMLPHLQPGGVFLCEDLTAPHHRFAAYVNGLSSSLNNMHRTSSRQLESHATGFQKDISSIHHYPYQIVIEKNKAARDKFISPKHGTHWQPFL